MIKIEEITNALIKITNNFENEFFSTTLLGWYARYDKEGRILNCDPNYRTGQAFIEDKSYYFIRKGWLVKIWDKPKQYTVFNDNDHIGEIDLTPDYVRESNG